MEPTPGFSGFRITNYWKYLLYLAGVILVLSIFVPAQEINNTYVDNKGKTRLFVTHGKRDGLNAKKLVELIKNICNIRGEKIRDIQILDNFSFVTLPFHEAEILLSHFKNRNQRKGLFVTKAKQKKKGRRKNK